MSATALLLFTVGTVIGASLGYAFLSSRAFDRKHPSARIAEVTEASHS